MTDDRPRPPRLPRAPKLHKHPRSGYFSAVFYDPARTPVRKWYALHTDVEKRAMRRFIAAEDAYMAGTLDPWRPQPTAAVAEPTARLSVQAAAERYAAERLADGSWRERTADNNLTRLVAFAGSMAPGLSPAHVTASDVKRFVHAAPATGARNVRDEKRLTPGSVKSYLAILRTFFDWCVAQGHADHNPAAAVAAPRLEKRAISHLEPAQFETLLKRLRSDHALKEATGTLWSPRQVLWLADTVELAVYTGLRSGELVRLRWRDVSLPRTSSGDGDAGATAATLYVRDTARGKTKTGERPVPLVPPATELLRRLEAERTNENPDAPVLLSPDLRRGEKPINGGQLATAFKKYVLLLGFDEALTPHSLRKTCGTWLLNRGVPMEVVQRMLGHSSLVTTQGSYAQVWDRTVRRQLDAAFSEAPEVSADTSGAAAV